MKSPGAPCHSDSAALHPHGRLLPSDNAAIKAPFQVNLEGAQERHAPLENALHFLAVGLSPYELIKISALASKLLESPGAPCHSDSAALHPHGRLSPSNNATIKAPFQVNLEGAQERHAPLENALHFLAVGLSPYKLIKISALASKLAERYFH